MPPFDRRAFLKARAAAYRANYEHLPLPARMRPDGAHMNIYTRIDWGRLASFRPLDGRQYRSHQACPKYASGGGWNVIAQQTLMAQIDRKAGEGKRVWTGGWDGYPAARRRLLEAVAARRPSNPVVIGGDVHAHWAADLKPDFDDPRSPVVASEFCGTSITAQGPSQKAVEAMLTENSHLRCGRGDRRDYVRVEIKAKQLSADLRAMESVQTRTAGCTTLARFIVEDGKLGAQKA